MARLGSNSLMAKTFPIQSYQDSSIRQLSFNDFGTMSLSRINPAQFNRQPYFGSTNFNHMMFNPLVIIGVDNYLLTLYVLGSKSVSKLLSLPGFKILLNPSIIENLLS